MNSLMETKLTSTSMYYTIYFTFTTIVLNLPAPALLPAMRGTSERDRRTRVLADCILCARSVRDTKRKQDVYS